MSTITIKREHTLSPSACTRARQELLTYLTDKLGACVSQEGDQLSFEGKGFKGAVCIRPGEASGQIQLGLLARAFKKQLETEINRQLDTRLGA